MTPLQRRALDHIAAFIQAQGMAPTYDEIAQALGQRARANAFAVVNSLIGHGYLARDGRGRRNITVLKMPPAPVMPVDTPALPIMARSLERWAAMVPTAVADGSRAQVVYALADAKADIAALARRINDLTGQP